MKASARSTGWRSTLEEAADDVKVRKAIATAIDKKFITKALMGGFASPADGPIVPTSPFYTDELVRLSVRPEEGRADA